MTSTRSRRLIQAPATCVCDALFDSAAVAGWTLARDEPVVEADMR